MTCYLELIWCSGISCWVHHIHWSCGLYTVLQSQYNRQNCGFSEVDYTNIFFGILAGVTALYCGVVVVNCTKYVGRLTFFGPGKPLSWAKCLRGWEFCASLFVTPLFLVYSVVHTLVYWIMQPHTCDTRNTSIFSGGFGRSWKKKQLEDWNVKPIPQVEDTVQQLSCGWWH